MRRSHHRSGAYRALWSWETAEYAAHLKRLDPAARRLRFHGSVSDRALDAHAARAIADRTVRVVGWFKDGVLRGAAEVALIDTPYGLEAEAAFAVEHSDRGHGVGRQLMERALLFARNRGARILHIATEAENRAMIALAAGSGADFDAAGHDVDGVLRAGERTVFSIGLEAIEEEAGAVAWGWARLRKAVGSLFGAGGRANQSV